MFSGYPTPHVDSATPESDIHFLAQKVNAGAHFIITQLFYDVAGFVAWVQQVRAAGINVPIVPGIMPIQNYASFKRLTNLCKCPVPLDILQDLDAIKADDAAVKRYGIQLSTRMIEQLLAADIGIHGVHFCTLNLEKSVLMVLENLGWTSSSHHQKEQTPTHQARNRVIDAGFDSAMVSRAASPQPDNVNAYSISPKKASHLALAAHQHHLHHQDHSGESSTTTTPTTTAATTTTHAHGQNEYGTGAGGAPVGPEDPWDEFPNGRFTDVRSPAYGEIDGWGNGLKTTPTQALHEWGTPVDRASLSSLFTRYLRSDPQAPTTPFCDLPISPESSLILDHLIKLNSTERGWWTVGSQPPVDGAKSDDPVHGFGPRGSYVFQKAFVEFFVPGRQQVDELLAKARSEPSGKISLYAGNKKVGLRLLGCAGVCVCACGLMVLLCRASL